MRQIRIGDITIDAVIEREGPWRRPQDFFPMYDDAVFKGHLPSMEPEVLCAYAGTESDRTAATSPASRRIRIFLPIRFGRREQASVPVSTRGVNGETKEGS